MFYRMRKLFFREWFVLVCVVSFFFTLFFVKTFSGSSFFELSCEVQSKKIQVVVLGAVERPGLYEVEVGSSIKSILEGAGLRKTADRKSLYLKKKVLNSCSLIVPEKKDKKKKNKIKVSSSMSVASYVVQGLRSPVECLRFKSLTEFLIVQKSTFLIAFSL